MPEWRATVGPATAAIAAGVFIAYQFGENHLIQPTLVSHAVEVPARAILLTAMADGAAARIVGAVVLTPMVGAAKAALGTSREPDFPGLASPSPVSCRPRADRPRRE